MNVDEGQLRQVYLATQFRVTEHSPPFTLRIGERSVQVLELFGSSGVASAAFLTAWNPRSEMQSDDANAAAQAKLVARLVATGHRCFAGIGEDLSGQWPGEPSLLALGVGRERAVQLGREFGQNAVVWVGAEGVPELVWLGDGAEVGDRSATSVRKNVIFTDEAAAAARVRILEMLNRTSPESEPASKPIQKPMIAWAPTKKSRWIRLTAVLCAPEQVMDRDIYLLLLGERVQRMVDAAEDPDEARDQLHRHLFEYGLMPDLGHCPTEEAGNRLVWSNPAVGEKLGDLGVLRGLPQVKVVEMTQAREVINQDLEEPMDQLAIWVSDLYATMMR